MCYFQFILAGGLWRLWVPKKASASTGTQYKQHMLFSWKPGLWSKEYLNSILKDQMSSPLSRPISGFGLDLLLRKVIHSNEVLWGLPQCSRCSYVTCIWNVWHQRGIKAAKILRSRTTESIISLAVCLWCVRLACLTFAPCDSLESLSACMRNVQFGSSEAQTVFILHLSTVYLAYV